MRTWVFIIVAMATIIICGCGNMGTSPQVKVVEFEIDVPLMEIDLEQSQLPAGVAPIIGLGATPETTSDVNLYIDMANDGLGVINPNFKKGAATEIHDPTSDDFVAHIQTPVVPKEPFKVLWLVNGVVIDEEDILQPNSQSWANGGRWKDAYPGDHTLKVIIDPDNKIPESNEEDNEYILGFSVPD